MQDIFSKFKTRIAIIDEDSEYSYTELSCMILNYASYAKTAFNPCSNVAIQLDDSVELVVAFFGLMQAGLVPVLAPKGYAFSTIDIDYYIDDYSSVTNTYKSNVSLELNIDINSKFILFTSGTTNNSKAVTHTLRNFIEAGKVFSEAIEVRENDKTLGTAKLFHAYGLCNLATAFVNGTPTILFKGISNPTTLKDLIEQHSPTIFYSSPRHYGALLQNTSKETLKDVFKSVRVFVSAGEVLPVFLNDVYASIDINILDCLGCSETLGFILKSGQVLDNITIKPIKVSDELYRLDVKAPYMYLKYSDTEGSSEYFQLNDLFKIEDGTFIHQGRVDDLVKINGKFTSPFSIENKIKSLPNVLDCIVVQNNEVKTTPILGIIIECSEQDYVGIRLQVIKLMSEYSTAFKVVAGTIQRTASGKAQRYKAIEII